jgi:hypothetical protein
MFNFWITKKFYTQPVFCNSSYRLVYVAIVGPMYNAIYWGSVNLDSGGFSGWTWIPGGSDSTPALA